MMMMGMRTTMMRTKIKKAWTARRPDAKAAAKAGMPGAAVVFHYDPIVILLQMAYSP